MTIDTCKIECFAPNYSASFSCSFYIFDCSESKLEGRMKFARGVSFHLNYNVLKLKGNMVLHYFW